MRRFLPFFLILALACALLPPGRAAPTPAALPTISAALTSLVATATPAAVGTSAPVASAPARAAASPAAATPAAATSAATTSAATTSAATTSAATTSAAATLTASPSPYHLTAADVHFEPDPQLYSGDIASIVVVGQGGSAVWQNAHASVFVNGPNALPLSQVEFAPYGLGNQWQATFTWAWDTRGRVGPQTVYVEVDPPAERGSRPISQTVAVPVNILPASARPAPESEAQWATAESNCCVFHYLTNTAAARDIDKIRSAADSALVHDAAVLGVAGKDKITFTLLSRLLGNGGFTTSEVSITYIDRNPAASDLFTIFAHEGTHVLDRQIARTRPVIMAEGLAVYVAGGHFKTEPLEARAVALLALNRYLPLTGLANDFYHAQHEIGYLEAAAFIQYLVETYGWPRFRTMYGSFNASPSDAQMLDAGLKLEYGQGLAQMEAAWLAHLRSLTPDPAQLSDLRLTIDLYDTMRRYQQLYDPSAYFLTAWLPEGSDARKRGIVADYIRHPDGPDNIALETMLVSAGQKLNAGQYDQAGALLDDVNAALDAGRLDANPVAAENLAVVQQVLADGYEPQQITLDQDSATVEAISQWPRLDQLNLRRGAGGWQVLAGGLFALRPLQMR